MNSICLITSSVSDPGVGDRVERLEVGEDADHRGAAGHRRRRRLAGAGAPLAAAARGGRGAHERASGEIGSIASLSPRSAGVRSGRTSTGVRRRRSSTPGPCQLRSSAAESASARRPLGGRAARRSGERSRPPPRPAGGERRVSAAPGGEGAERVGEHGGGLVLRAGRAPGGARGTARWSPASRREPCWRMTPRLPVLRAPHQLPAAHHHLALRGLAEAGRQRGVGGPAPGRAAAAPQPPPAAAAPPPGRG